jgi:RimJ/RimL family protein N-acetyltransferase
METTAVKDFEFVRGNLAALPYDPRTGVFTVETLIMLYKKLHSEDLWDTVFHENPDMSLFDYLVFFNSGKTLLAIFSIVNGDEIVEIAGMAWLADITTCKGDWTRALGSFVFFKDYQKPSYTDQFSEIVLDYWFNRLNVDLIIGETPEENIAAKLFVKRIGFTHVATIPKYTTIHGIVSNSTIVMMTKEEHRQLRGQ